MKRHGLQSKQQENRTLSTPTTMTVLSKGSPNEARKDVSDNIDEKIVVIGIEQVSRKMVVDV